MDKRQALTALVLAGTRQREPDLIARGAGVSCKAFAPVAGRPMVERVVQVLLDYPEIERIDVALPGDTRVDEGAPGLAAWMSRGRVHCVDARASPAQTVAAALADLDEHAALLVTTADHALLRAAMLDQFLAGCGDADTDAFAGLLPLDILESRYPGMRRTGLRLREGRFSGCNLFLIRSGHGGRSLVSFWQTLESLRKSPWRMARSVGPAVLLQYALGRLSLHRALDHIGRRTGARIAPVILDIPEAAIDVDTPRDLAFAEKLLG